MHEPRILRRYTPCVSSSELLRHVLLLALSILLAVGINHEKSVEEFHYFLLPLLLGLCLQELQAAAYKNLNNVHGIEGWRFVSLHSYFTPQLSENT